MCEPPNLDLHAPALSTAGSTSTHLQHAHDFDVAAAFGVHGHLQQRQGRDPHPATRANTRTMSSTSLDVANQHAAPMSAADAALSCEQKQRRPPHLTGRRQRSTLSLLDTITLKITRHDRLYTYRGCSHFLK